MSEAFAASVGPALEMMIEAKDWMKRTGMDEGEMDCLVCGTGKVHYRLTPGRRNQRRHSRGACTTPNCVQWIE